MSTEKQKLSEVKQVLPEIGQRFLVSGTEMMQQSPEDFQKQYAEAEGHIPYLEFVKTTFAYTNDTPTNVAWTLDLLHLTIGFVGEWIEYQNEYQIYEDLLFDREQSEIETPDRTIEISLQVNKQKTKVEKELGDLCYYTAMLHNCFCFGGVIIPEPNKDQFDTLVEDFVDGIKRKLFYKLPIENGHFASIVHKMWQMLANVAYNNHAMPLQYFILQNKKKLQARYPQGKFSSQDAAEKKDNQVG